MIGTRRKRSLQGAFVAEEVPGRDSDPLDWSRRSFDDKERLTTPLNAQRNYADVFGGLPDSTRRFVPIEFMKTSQRTGLHFGPLPSSRLAATRHLQSTELLSLAYGCLLIPVGIAVWWLWTKRTATKIIQKVLPPSQACNGNDFYTCPPEGKSPEDANLPAFGSNQTDPYETWDQVVSKQDKKGNHFVRWIRGSQEDDDEKKIESWDCLESMSDLEMCNRHKTAAIDDEISEASERLDHMDWKKKQQYQARRPVVCYSTGHPFVV